MGVVRFLRRNAFVLSLLVLFVLADLTMAAWDPVNRLPQFDKTDLAKIQHVHPEQPWNRVFFGNSAVTASYIEKQSDSGVINMGIAYGKITDLEAILKKETVQIRDEIILGLNFFALMDALPTNPGYIWLKKPYEPYFYFYRSQLKDFLMTNPTGKPKDAGIYWLETYPNNLSEADLQQKVKEYQAKYGNLTLADFQDNLVALESVIKICEERGIRLRAIWMPWNPYAKPPAYVSELKREVNATLAAHRVETLDWTNKFTAKDFHDLGHIEYIRGAPKFTQQINQWLRQ